MEAAVTYDSIRKGDIKAFESLNCLESFILRYVLLLCVLCQSEMLLKILSRKFL